MSNKAAKRLCIGSRVMIHIDTTDGPRTLMGTIEHYGRRAWGIYGRVRLDYSPLCDYTGDTLEVHPDRIEHATPATTAGKE